jgi:hypothetical protein
MAILSRVLAESDRQEREKLKAAEYTRLVPVKEVTLVQPDGTYKLDVRSVSHDGMGAVEVYFRAWKDGVPVGFGADGSVEIERYHALNPPIMVRDDVNGTYVIDKIDRDTGRKIGERKYREAPVEVLYIKLLGVVRRFGKGPQNIQPGKVGRSTIQRFPSAGTGTAPTDGELLTDDGAGTTWADLHDAAAADILTQTFTGSLAQIRATAGGAWRQITRFYAQFDTSAIGAGTVTAAVWTLRGDGNAVNNSFSASMNVVAFSPTDEDSIAVGDYDLFGTTVFSTKAISAWDTTDGNDNDFTFTDLSGINGSGITNLGLRESNDRADAEPSITGSERSKVTFYAADNAGTTDDPELNVTYTAAGSTVAPGKDDLVITGLAPTAIEAKVQSPGKDDLVITGYAPSIAGADLTVSPGKDDLVIAGRAPLAALQVVTQPGKDDLVITGHAATANSGLNVQPGKDDLAITGAAPSAILAAVANPGKDDIVITGLAPTTAVGLGDTVVAPGKGDLSLTLFAATIAVVASGWTKTTDDTATWTDTTDASDIWSDTTDNSATWTSA